MNLCIYSKIVNFKLLFTSAEITFASPNLLDLATEDKFF